MGSRVLSLLGLVSLMAGVAMAGEPEDPFLWLEDVTGDRALSWVRERNAESTAELAKSPEFRTLERFRGTRRPVGRGKEAAATSASFAFVECHPLTGRTHQLRVHLAAAGAPILNDPFYGVPEITLKLSDLKRGYKGREEEKPLIGRLALHATELTLKHPTTREPITLRAPLPHEFEVALKYLRKFAAVSAPRAGTTT